MQNKDEMHPDDKRNMIIFIVASLIVWIAFDNYLLRPKMEEVRAAQQKIQEEQERIELDPVYAEQKAAELPRPRADVIIESSRIKFRNAVLSGSILLKGGRLDDVILNNHFQTLAEKKNVAVFSPAGSLHPKYAGFGWLSSRKEIKVPNADSVWRVRGSADLTPDKPLTLSWDNGQGFVFERQFSMDDNFLINVTQRVINNSDQDVKFYPYSLIVQHGYPADFEGKFVVHEGPIGYIGDELIEIQYRKMAKAKQKPMTSSQGWIGISEHYWFSALIPSQGEESEYRFVYREGPEGRDQYQVDLRGMGQVAGAGKAIENTVHVFVGAKNLDLLDGYETQLGTKHLDLALDFGMFYFMTKPFFHVLEFLGSKTGNFGIAIILLTILIRIGVFPLANASYRSFAKLKMIAPKMTELREKYGDDKQQLQQALVKLYEKEKVNPMAGCFPILIQIPIFFALFKVLNVAIEMRHAPFYGWIDDLSAQDPTTLFNLFGLLPYSVPGFLMIGAWPCIMLFFMLLQKQMNPPPQDKTQAMVMNFMPFFITFILAKFSAGLVIYWTFSNALSVVQQYIIMRSMGVEVRFWGHEEAAQKEAEAKEKEEEEKKADETESKVEEIKEISPPKPKKKKKKK